MSVLLALALGAATAGRAPLGVWSGWGAFRDAAPLRCFAIARPASAGGARRRAFASVGRWPGRGDRARLFLRLSAARQPGSVVTLSIGDRRFVLAGTGSGVWSPDARTDVAAIAAMRGGRSMSVESVSAAGRPFADSYALAGAATAIDAAALGCARR